jgi:hypothetical protein
VLTQQEDFPDSWVASNCRRETKDLLELVEQNNLAAKLEIFGSFYHGFIWFPVKKYPENPSTEDHISGEFG